MSKKLDLIGWMNAFREQKGAFRARGEKRADLYAIL